MKVTAARAESFVAALPPAIRAVLIYGPDAGLVQERLSRLTKTVVDDPNDPFRVVDLTMASLKESPGRLADEAVSLCLTGGRRVVRLRNAGDQASRSVEPFLDHPVGDALLLVEASELGPRSSLRKLFEAADNGAALPCYADEGEALAGIIRSMLNSFGLKPDPEALHYLEGHLGGDRLMTRSEIEKLVSYMGKEQRVTLAHAAACIGDGTSLSLDDLVLDATDGNQAASQRSLDRLLRENISPITILRALSRHLQRLHLACNQAKQGVGVDQVLSSFRPPLHFRTRDRMKRQIGVWAPERIGWALQQVQDAEVHCKRTGIPADEICGRALLGIAAAARRR